VRRTVQTAELYAYGMYGLAGGGLALARARARRGWRVQVSVLLALTAMWAVALGVVLSDDAIGHDCSAADHSGELPALIVAIAWAAALLAALLAPRPPAARTSIRVGMPLATVAVIGGSLAALVLSQRTGC
jgi:hypothetical protein